MMVLCVIRMQFQKGAKEAKTIRSESLCLHLHKNVTAVFEQLDLCAASDGNISVGEK